MAFRMVSDEEGSRPIEVVEARGLLARSVGLLGTAELASGRGLLLRTKQVHTFGMRYAIDALYLGRDGRVLKVVSLRPGRLGPLVLGARHVLEVPAGDAERFGIRRGSLLLREAGG